MQYQQGNTTTLPMNYQYSVLFRSGFNISRFVLVKKQHYFSARLIALAGQLICLTLLGACASRAPAGWPADAARLPPQVAEVLRQANIPDEAMAVVVQRLSDGALIASRHPSRPMQPASSMKLVTTAVALEQLGPTFRGRVEMRTAAETKDGVLNGDLVLRGLAPLEFSWRDLQTMLQTLRASGIREIAGDVVIDRSHFRPARADIGVPPFDESPEWPYNVIPDALNLNSSLLQFDIRSDAAAVSIKIAPPLDNTRFISTMTLIDQPCEKWEDGWKIPQTRKRDDGVIEVELQGAFPINCVATPQLNVIDRADVAARLLTGLWRAEGGVLRGRVREHEGVLPSQMRLLAEFRARPLSETVRDMNKRSDNPMTRLTYLSLGANSANVGASSTFEDANAVVRGWFREKGIATDGLVMENGSGLSRSERITAAQLAALLRAMHRSKWAPEFMASLPIAALDGTMRNRLKNSPAKEVARMKTGTLRNVSAVAGYLPDATGQLCVAVVIINDEKGGDNAARAAIDALLDWVVREGGK
jgi:serine-type D-Ala-D-Ala carboxypeptidase/endopeptidase (penicillin-binding protein 4)